MKEHQAAFEPECAHGPPRVRSPTGRHRLSSIMAPRSVFLKPVTKGAKPRTAPTCEWGHNGGAGEMTDMLKTIQNSSEKFSRFAVYAGGVILVLAACLVVFEVIARKFFSFTITGVEELSGYAYAISMAWGFSFTLFQRGHIRVDVVYVLLPYRLRFPRSTVELSTVRLRGPPPVISQSGPK